MMYRSDEGVRRLVQIVVLLFAFSGCGADADQDIHRVSMVELIASPEKWEGRVVSVSGYFNVENGMLFLTREHASARDLESAVPVGGSTGPVDFGDCSSAVSRVVGRFVISDIMGSAGLFEDIRILRWIPEKRDYAECFKEASE